MADCFRIVANEALCLSVLRRLGLRIAGRMPPPSAILTPFERVASRTAHLSLYLLTLATPVLGEPVVLGDALRLGDGEPLRDDVGEPLTLAVRLTVAVPELAALALGDALPVLEPLADADAEAEDVEVGDRVRVCVVGAVRVPVPVGTADRDEDPVLLPVPE